MPRPLVGLIVIPCLFVTVQSAARSPTLLVHWMRHSHTDGCARHIASETFTHVPRGGETAQGIDKLPTVKVQSARDQPRYPFSLISAFRVLHKKSMLVKGGEEGEEKLEFVLGEGEEKDGPNSAAVEVSSSFVDDDENRSNNVHTESLSGEGVTMRVKEIKGNARHSQNNNISPSKSRKTHRNVTEKKAARRDGRRQSRSHRTVSHNINSSSGVEGRGHEKENEGCLDGNMDNSLSTLSTDLDGNKETKAPPVGEDGFAIPLCNRSAECRESLYISSGHVSIIVFASDDCNFIELF